MMMLLALPTALLAIEPAGPWLEGRAFQLQLQAQVGFSWSQIPLRQALTSLAESQRVAVFLDRRIDPGKVLDLQVRDASLRGALGAIAAELDGGLCYLGPLVYIGPSSITNRLATLAELRRQEAYSLPTADRHRLLEKQRWRWDDLTTPRELVEQLAERAGLRIENLDSLPHDLWPAADLPPLSVVDRLSLVLAGFGFTFELSRDATTARLLTAPERVVLERGYRIDRKSDLELLEAIHHLGALVPAATVRRRGSGLVVVGSYEDQMAVDSYLRGEQPPHESPAVGEKRFRLTIRNAAVGAVLAQLAEQLQLELEVSASAETYLEERISFQVEEVTLAELLRAALAPVGLDFQLDGSQLRISRFATPP